MTTNFPLTFRVHCRACYGAEIWHLERIVHTLTNAGVLSPLPETDVERVAELFITHSEQVACATCGKTKVLLVHRVKPGNE